MGILNLAIDEGESYLTLIILNIWTFRRKFFDEGTKSFMEQIYLAGKYHILNDFI